jgi:hypothetical protein
MIVSTQKEIRQLKDLEERLNSRFAGAIFGQDAFDANGNPEVLFSNGTPVSGGRVFLLKIVQEPMVSTDIFGNPALAYGPHKIQLAFEQGAAVTGVDFCRIMSEVGKLGYKLEVYMTPAGNIPVDAALIPANLQDSLEFDIYWPTKGN